jgi:hypothetical protein
MKQLILITIPLLILNSFHVIAAISDEAREVIDNYIQASGGLEKRSSIKNGIMKGVYKIPEQGLEASVKIYYKHPSKTLSILLVPHIGEIQSGFNGEEAWELNPITGFREITGAELEQSSKDAILFPELKVDQLYKSGDRKPDRDDGMIVIEFTAINGFGESWVFDPQTNFLVEKIMMIDGGVAGSFPIHSYLSNYKEVDGIKVPHTLRVSNPAFEVAIDASEYFFNTAIEDSIFEAPKSSASGSDSKNP